MEKKNLSGPRRTRQDAPASFLQYIQPLATRHGTLIKSARVF